MAKMECFFGRLNEVTVMGMYDGEMVTDRIIPICPPDPHRRAFNLMISAWEDAVKLGLDHGWAQRGILITIRGLVDGVMADTLVPSMNYVWVAWGANAPAKMTAEDAGAWADALDLVLANPATWPAERLNYQAQQPSPTPFEEVITTDDFGRVILTTWRLRNLIDWLRCGEFEFAMDD